jgi:hypothetical protein
LADEQILPALGAAAAADLVFWTAQDLYDWLNEGLKQLARRRGLFIERDTSISVVASTASYTLPARHLSTLHVALDGAELRPATVRAVEALDADWPNTEDTPERYLQDVAGLGSIRLYPTPDDSGTLGIVFHRYPADVADSDSIPAPDTISDYLADVVIAEARGTEGDGAMPEAAEFCRQEGKLYEAVFRGYWGMAQ